MQAINRIPHAMINANAGMQGALVVGIANAHRSYPSFQPCDTSPVSKCPGKGSRTSKVQMTERSQRRTALALEKPELLTTGPVGRMWRLESHHDQMPAAIWAAVVLNRKLCD